MAASASGRRGRRQLGWPTVLCFGSHGAHGKDALASTSRPRRKRTVPVDAELVARPVDCKARPGAEEEGEGEAGKGPRARACCCFLPPARVPAGRQDTALESGGGGSNINRERRQQARPQDDQNPPCQAPETRQVQTRVAPATTAAADARAPTRLPTTPRDAATKNEASARGFFTAAGGGGGHGTKAGGAGAFGPPVGLSVVAAVSMASLLGGPLWAVACVCAWLVVLSRLHQRRDAQLSAGGIAGSDVTLTEEVHR